MWCVLVTLEAERKESAVPEEDENADFESRNSHHLENWWPYWNSIDTIEFFQSQYIHFDA